MVNVLGVGYSIGTGGSDPSQQMTQCVGLILSSTNWRVRPSIPLALLPYPASLYSPPTLHPDRKPWDTENASFSLNIYRYQTLVYILQRKLVAFPCWGASPTQADSRWNGKREGRREPHGVNWDNNNRFGAEPASCCQLNTEPFQGTQTQTLTGRF